MKVFIYGLVDPRTKEIRYVGQSKDPKNRLKQHLSDNQYTPKVKWLHELKKEELQPKLKILEVSNTSEWVDKEKYWIQKGLKDGWPLTNLSGGGEGQSDLSIEAELSHWFEMFKLDVDTNKLFPILERNEKLNLLIKMALATVPHLRGLLNELELIWATEYGIEYQDNGLYYDEDYCHSDLNYFIYEFWGFIDPTNELGSKGPGDQEDY